MDTCLRARVQRGAMYRPLPFDSARWLAERHRSRPSLASTRGTATPSPDRPLWAPPNRCPQTTTTASPGPLWTPTDARDARSSLDATETEQPVGDDADGTLSLDFTSLLPFLISFMTFELLGGQQDNEQEIIQWLAARGAFDESNSAARGLSQEAMEGLATVRVEGGIDRACTICLEDFAQGEVAKKLPCDHLFHPGCIDTWLAEKGTCPLCRAAVVPS